MEQREFPFSDLLKCISSLLEGASWRGRQATVPAGRGDPPGAAGEVVSPPRGGLGAKGKLRRAERGAARAARGRCRGRPEGPFAREVKHPPRLKSRLPFQDLKFFFFF